MLVTSLELIFSATWQNINKQNMDNLLLHEGTINTRCTAGGLN